MPPKRKQPAASGGGKRPVEQDEGDATATAKKFKSAMDEIADEYICPITQELPFDPVTAEDGNVYERSAIEALIDVKGAAHLKSPITNLPMGTKLMPNRQARAAIEKLVKSGALSGDKAALWQERLKEEEELNELKCKAASGDFQAMLDLGRHYENGTFGLKKDANAAARWVQKAADLDYPPAQLELAKNYIQRNSAHALMLLVQVAVQPYSESTQCCAKSHECASLWAKLFLVKVYCDGLSNFPANAGRARYWFDKVDEARLASFTECEALVKEYDEIRTKLAVA